MKQSVDAALTMLGLWLVAMSLGYWGALAAIEREERSGPVMTIEERAP
ncbi:MAG: hypothetical protein AAFQ73_16600 [Pseudomonadota bacterium]